MSIKEDMKKKILTKDGGPAFPIDFNDPLIEDGFDGITRWNMGMSRRDYFAAAALAGGLEQGVQDNMGHSWWHNSKVIAERAYEIADAMLEISL